MSDCILAGNAVTRLDLHVPWAGPWRADVALAEGVVLAGRVELELGGRTLVGTVRRGGVYQGQGRYRIVGGADGWPKSVGAQAYQADTGVLLSTVLGDAAAAVGETVVMTDRSLGAHFVRQAGPAQRVLAQVIADAETWWVDDAGVTNIGARPAGLLATSLEVLDVDESTGLVLVACETPLELEPGKRIVAGGAEREIRSVIHRMTRERVRTEVWTIDLAEARGTWTREALPGLAFLGFYEYRVISQDGALVDLQAIRQDRGLPDLRDVLPRPGVAGGKAAFAPGAHVVVGFLEGDPTRPFVAFAAGETDPGHLPEEAHLDAEDRVAVGASAAIVELGSGSEVAVSATGRVLRYGDSIIAPTMVQLGTPFVLQEAPGIPVAKVSA